MAFFKQHKFFFFLKSTKILVLERMGLVGYLRKMAHFQRNWVCSVKKATLKKGVVETFEARIH